VVVTALNRGHAKGAQGPDNCTRKPALVLAALAENSIAKQFSHQDGKKACEAAQRQEKSPDESFWSPRDGLRQGNAVLPADVSLTPSHDVSDGKGQHGAQARYHHTDVGIEHEHTRRCIAWDFDGLLGHVKHACNVAGQKTSNPAAIRGCNGPWNGGSWRVMEWCAVRKNASPRRGHSVRPQKKVLKKTQWMQFIQLLIHQVCNGGGLLQRGLTQKRDTVRLLGGCGE